MKIIAPGPEIEFAYVNRKNQHSLNVQAISTADRRFINVVIKSPGSAHDAKVFRESNIGIELATGTKKGVLLGDSGYGLTPFLLTPYDNPATAAERRFNAAHKKTRVRVEQALGVLKRRFACLHFGIRMSPSRCCAVIAACFVLHNIAMSRYGEQTFLNALDIDDNDLPEPPTDNNAQATRSTLEARKRFRNHIVTRFFS